MLKQYYLEILKSLSEGAKRYSDLDVACLNEATRSIKLREMLKEGLIETFVQQDKKRMAVYYRLTGKGKKLLVLM